MLAPRIDIILLLHTCGPLILISLIYLLTFDHYASHIKIKQIWSNRHRARYGLVTMTDWFMENVIINYGKAIRFRAILSSPSVLTTYLYIPGLHFDFEGSKMCLVLSSYGGSHYLVPLSTPSLKLIPLSNQNREKQQQK